MSNSKLVSYTAISPNRTSPRNHKIDTVTIHCVVGQLTVEALGNIFSNPNAEASSNYGIGLDGKIGMYVEEKDRSWCSSSRSNDNRAITIEVASDTTHPYAVNDKAYNSLITLLVDICKRNNIKKLLWQGDKSLIGQVDKQNMTVHRWFADKACPGDYLYYRHGAIANAVNKALGASPNPAPAPNKPASTNNSYKVRVDTSNLRIRKTPSINGEIVGVVQPGVYTIIKETVADNYHWGQLKSGAGWIALEYCVKI